MGLSGCRFGGRFRCRAERVRNKKILPRSGKFFMNFHLPGCLLGDSRFGGLNGWVRWLKTVLDEEGWVGLGNFRAVVKPGIFTIGCFVPENGGWGGGPAAADAGS
jgi:hypothetical protein